MSNLKIMFAWILIGSVYAEFVPVRLTGGYYSNVGRLEVNFNGKWNQVCNNTWTKNNSEVVCKQLGFNRVDVWPDGYEIADVAGHRLYTFEFSCNGFEAGLYDCQRTRLGRWLCAAGVGQDVKIQCTNTVDKNQVLYQGFTNLVGASDPLAVKNEGIIITYLYGKWGRMCTENWSDEDSKIVCKQLGFDSDSVSLAPANRYDVKSVDHLPFHNVTIICVGDEGNLTECTFSNQSCSAQSKDVAMTCTSESNAGSAGKVVAIFVGFCFLLLFLVTASYMWKRHQKEKNTNSATSFPVTHFPLVAQSKSNEYVQVEHSGTTSHTNENE